MMTATISNVIEIDDPSPELKQYVKDELELPNPDYEKKLRMGFWTGRTPKKIRLYEWHGNRLILPFGLCRDILPMLRAGEVKTAFKEPEKVDYGKPIPLYDYQREAMDCMVSMKYGILKAPAGSGKTQTGLAIIQKIGTKALWLCTKHDLLKQSYDRAKQYMDENLFGTITEGKVSIGKGITFSTVQTLAGTDLNRYRDEWDVVIVDECHGIGVSATTVTRYQKVLNNLAAKHKYGLSATPDRSDGLIKATFSLIGNVVCEIPESAVADRIMRVKVKAVETEAEVTEECQNVDGTLNYTKLIEHLTTDTDRNRLIVRTIMEEKDHSCLVLSDRIAHLEALRNLLPYELQEKSALITGKMTSKKDKALREEILEQMRTGELKYLFASYSLAKEGLDVPRLDRLFLATPVKFSSVVIQSIGRIARTFPGKAEPVAYDFVDTGIGFCKRAYRERRKHYKTVDAKIVQWFD